jgi:hypothetical protein
VANTLEYAQPDRQMMSRRRFGWIACVISVLLALGAGLDSVRLAFYFLRPIGRGPGQRDPYWFIDKQLNLIGAPIIFLLAMVGCIVCWRRKTGRWLSIAALLLGIACWIGAAITYPRGP